MSNERSFSFFKNLKKINIGKNRMNLDFDVDIKLLEREKKINGGNKRVHTLDNRHPFSLTCPTI